MAEAGEHIKMAVDLAVQFHDDDLMAYNTVAEIPGTDLKDEVVMLGGHMDSWHSGTGATDNAAGVLGRHGGRADPQGARPQAAPNDPHRPLERRGRGAARLRAPTSRSTSAESQTSGRQFGTPPNRRDARHSAAPRVSDAKPEYDKFSAYFNLDNGTGKIRGVYMQGNEAVRPIFRKWLQPFRDMGLRR